MTELASCPLCGKNVEHVHGLREITVGKRRVTVEDNFVHCQSCKEDFYAPGQLTELQRRAADRIRADEGLLTPAEIKAIREGMGLTQAEFEKLLGVGEKTVIRWEKGTVFQSRATDSLLRLVGNVPKAAQYLGGLMGVSIAEFPRVPAMQYVLSPTRGGVAVFGPGTYWTTSPTPLVVHRASVKRADAYCKP